MPLLPDRPLRLSASFARKTLLKAAFFTAVAVGMGGLIAYFGAMELRAYLAERELWAAGTPAPEAAVEGEVTTHEWLGFIPVGREYKLVVQYLDAAGSEHEAKLELTSLTELDTAAEPEVRLDPADPTRFALSWAAEAGFGRWSFGGGATLLGLVMAAAGVLALRGALRTVASARACARRSDERELPLLKSERQQANGKPLNRWVVTYTLPPGPRGAGGKRSATIEGEPVVLDRDGGPRVLALLSPDAEQPTFPTVTLAPFDVSPEERTAFEARLSADRERSAARQSA